MGVEVVEVVAPAPVAVEVPVEEECDLHPICVEPADRFDPRTDCDSSTTILTILQQNVQMCTRMTQKCDMVNEQVCQQVPVRVPVPGKKMVPQPPRWEMKCEDITEVRIYNTPS